MQFERLQAAFETTLTEELRRSHELEEQRAARSGLLAERQRQLYGESLGKHKVNK